MAQQSNDFVDMVDEMNGDINEMDIMMSQVVVQVEQEGEVASGQDFGKEVMVQDEMDVEGELNIPAALLQQYYKAMDDILPNKSGNRYLQALEVFNKWQTLHGTTSFDEKVLMAYFLEAGEKYKPPTLWSMFSMLKKTLICKKNIDISKYCQLIAWLKKRSDGYESKQSVVFTPEEINRFVIEAPDIMYLAMKAVLGFGILGACRGDELTKLIFDNVKDTGSDIIVKVPTTKNKEPKSYVVDGEFTNIIRRYIKLRPPHITTDRFFIQFRNGKCVNQVMGKHSIAKIPKAMATFLQLPNPENYTGHSYRRTGTTIAADNGARFGDLKRLGNWKSNNIVDKYIKNSMTRKRKIAKQISGALNLPSTNVYEQENIAPSVESSTSSVAGGLLSVDVRDEGKIAKRISRALNLPSTLVHTQETFARSVESSASSVAGGLVVTRDGGTSLSQSLNNVGIKIPENKNSIIFHFGGECITSYG